LTTKLLVCCIVSNRLHRYIKKLLPRIMLIDAVDACRVNVVQVGAFYHTLEGMRTDHRVETLPNRSPVFELKRNAARIAHSFINLNFQAVLSG